MAFLAPLTDTFYLYAAVERDTPADEVVAVAMTETGPEWLDRPFLASAITSARELDAAGVCAFTRADGGSFYAPMMDPPRLDVAGTAPIPRLLPLIETMHRAVDHLVVILERQGDLAFSHFPERVEPTAWTLSVGSQDPAAIASAIASAVNDDVEVVVVSVPENLAAAVVDRLDSALPPRVKVQAVDPGEDIAEATVVAVADYTAVDLVQAIRTFRFMESHHAVVEGLDQTARALADNRVARLFLSAAAEELTLSVGSGGREIVADPSATFASGPAMAVSASDGLIRAAILQGVSVQVIPEHLYDGPADGVGATLR